MTRLNSRLPARREAVLLAAKLAAGAALLAPMQSTRLLASPLLIPHPIAVFNAA